MKRCSVLICAMLSIGPPVTKAEAGQVPQAAQQAYDKGEYDRAIALLKVAAEKDPNNGDIQLLLTKSYLEAKKYDDAVKSGEKAVAINPNSSLYHQWLGEAYGEKADHASMLSAYGLARKTQKEFETAVQLDEHNFDAAQDLVQYDCTAPGMVGGGVEKAELLSQKLMSMDPAEGHYSIGLCKAVKKDFLAADAEYAKALESKPKTTDRLFDIGDYFMQRGQGDKLLEVAAQGEKLAPNDPRSKYYRAVGWTLKGEKLPDAEKLLKEYLNEAPVRSTYPSPQYAHYWLGRLDELQKDTATAKDEYREALKLDPKFKRAEEALKSLNGHGKG
jgi:tetratricopeptide (TPR) repeat protein